MSADAELPNSIHEKFDKLEEALSNLENSLKPFMKIPITDIRDKIEDPLENAKIDLMVAYTTNSLFWTYLITQGVDPRNHPIKDELIRIKGYMQKIQLAEEKRTRSKVDTSAAKRFVRNALWTPSDSKKTEVESQEEGTSEVDEDENKQNKKNKKDKKRKNEDSTKDKKRKKKKKKD